MSKRSDRRTRRWTAAGLFFLLSLALGGGLVAEPLARHVVLISIDGLRPEFYLDPSWPAPTIQQMAREGAHAERVRSVFPSVTYPSHTAMVTGALPARSGIYYNRPFEPSGQTGRWYWEETAIRVETLWDAVREAGGKTAAVSWPVTVGAPIDWLIPEVWSLDPEAEPLAAMRDATRPPELWAELEREATGRLGARTLSIEWMSRDDATGAIGSYLLETYRPTLLALHLLSSDHFQHESGRSAPIVRRALAACDRAVSAVVEAAQRAGIFEETAFIVTGDHGFVDVHTEMAPNVWLAEAGLTGTQPDRGEWRATFHTSGGSALLHLQDAGDREAEARVRALLAAHQERYGKLFRIVERPELDRIGADPRAPLALAAGLGVQFVARADGPLLAAGEGGQHGFFPTDSPEIYTGFVGWGAGFRAGAVAHVLGLEDVAPIVARLVGIELEVPDGILPLGLLSISQETVD